MDVCAPRGPGERNQVWKSQNGHEIDDWKQTKADLEPILGSPQGFPRVGLYGTVGTI